MEILLIIAVLALAIWWFFMRETTKVESNSAPYKVETPPTVNTQITDAVTQQPGWHTAPPADVKPVELTDALDVNQDGKVNLEDVKEVVKKVRKPRTPKAEKPAAKPTTKKAAPKKAAAMKAKPKTTRSKKS